MGLVLHVIRRPLFRIAKHGMCIDHKVKESAVAGLLVVGMVAAGDVPKHPLHCARVGGGAEFQRLVKVHEARVFHHMPLRAFCSASCPLDSPWRHLIGSTRAGRYASLRRSVLSVAAARGATRSGVLSPETSQAARGPLRTDVISTDR